MEDKLFDKFIKKEISKEEKLEIPRSIDMKLNRAYEAINQNSVDIKTKKNPRRRNIAIAASLTLAILGGSVTNPAIAEKIPVLNELSNSLKKIYWFNDNYISSADKINIMKKDKGIEISLEGVIYDESSLKFIYTLTSEKKLQWGVQMRKQSLKINGKNILADSYYNRVESDEIKMSKEKDKLEKYAVITSFDVSDLKLDDKVDIDWAINEIHTWDGKYEDGNWRFKFKTSKEALKASSKVVNANYSIEKEGYKFSIDKIIFTPTEIKITTNVDNKIYKDMYNAHEKYKNNPNDKEAKETIEKLRKIEDEFNMWNASVMDENGNIFISTMGKGNNGDQVALYKPLKEIPKKIIYTPRDYNLRALKDFEPSYEYIPLNNIKVPFEYVQGENISIVINSIKNNNGKVNINATFKGDFIAQRVGMAFVILPNTLKYSVDGDEKDKFYSVFKSINKTKSWEYVEEANNINNTFDFEFELKDGEEYNLVFEKIPKGYYKKDKQIIIDVK